MYIIAAPERRWKHPFTGFGQPEWFIEETPALERVQAQQVPEWVFESWMVPTPPQEPSETRYVSLYQAQQASPEWLSRWASEKQANPVTVQQPTETGFLPVLKSLIQGATVLGSKYLETRTQEKRIKAGLPPISPITLPVQKKGILEQIGISTNTALLVGAGIVGVMAIKKSRAKEARSSTKTRRKIR